MLISFQRKQKWYERTIFGEMAASWSMGGIGENRPKFHLFTLGGAQGGESGIFTDFAHTSNGCHFVENGSLVLNFFFNES